MLPAQETVKQYVNTSKVRSVFFHIVSTKDLSEQEFTDLMNQGLLEKICEWVDSRSIEGELPALPNSKDAYKLHVVSAQHDILTNMTTGKLKIKFELQYFQEVIL